MGLTYGSGVGGANPNPLDPLGSFMNLGQGVPTFGGTGTPSPAVPSGAQLSSLTGASAPAVAVPGVAPTVAPAVAPAVPPAAGAGGLGSFFGNTDNLKMVGGGIQALGDLWMSWKGLQLAGDTLDFQKEAWSTNLENQEQSYNTALADKAHARAAYTGQNRQQTRRYINQNSL